MKKLIMPLAALAISTGAVLANGKMNDLEIAHTAYTAGQLDIRYAHLALAVSESKAVREFAQTMLRDHGAVNKQDCQPGQQSDICRQSVDHDPHDGRSDHK